MRLPVATKRMIAAKVTAPATRSLRADVKAGSTCPSESAALATSSDPPPVPRRYGKLCVKTLLAKNNLLFSTFLGLVDISSERSGRHEIVDRGVELPEHDGVPRGAVQRLVGQRHKPGRAKARGKALEAR